MSREARRVLTSRSLPDVGSPLSIFLVGAYALQGVSVRLDQRLGLTVHRAVVCRPEPECGGKAPAGTRLRPDSRASDRCRAYCYRRRASPPVGLGQWFTTHY